MPTNRTRDALQNKLEQSIAAAQQNIPAGAIRDQLPGRTLPPTGNTGSGYTPAAHTHDWGDITGTPTTLAGYGITDAYTKTESDALYSLLGHTHSFASLTSKPTTISGYGITDAYTKTEVDALIAGVGGSGTVTSVALTVPSFLSVAGSPITGAGTLAVTLATQSANLIFAGPGSGSAATPTFRSLVALDIPNLDWAKITTGLPTTLAGYGITDAYTKTASDARYAPIAIVGTVTSVALTVPAILSIAGSPITTSGTLAITLATQSANLAFAGPASGSAATPTFRALVALDIPNLDWAKITSGTPTTLAGYGITDAYTKTAADARYAPIAIVGTVTSVAMTVPTIFSVAGSPVTTSGTLAVTLATQSANLAFAGPATGAAAAPTFRALVASDMPATAVTPGTYGSATNIGSFTVDAQGHITAASNIASGPLSGIFTAGVNAPRSSGSLLFALDVTNTGSALTIVNNGTATPFGAGRVFSGLIIISETAVNGNAAMFLVDGGGTITLVAAAGATWSVTATTASKTNVYLVSGAVTIENKLGSSATYNIMALRTRTA